MKNLTERQLEILGFIDQKQRAEGTSPSLREIAAHFRFRSMTAALCHVRALQQKGFLQKAPRRARSLQITRKKSPVHREKTDSKTRASRSWIDRAAGLFEVPIYGNIPAGLSEHRTQENRGCLNIDLASLHIPPSSRLFALEVRGDSMIGKHIIEGDYVIFEHGRTPRPGDVVAALIDNESTLKTFIVEKGRPCLKAENPKYPNLIPAQELVIQGVMLALVRKAENGHRKKT
jgi:repressor LexA